MIKNLEDKELRALAEDIYSGRVFTSAHVAHENQDVSMCFPILVMLNEGQLEEVKGAGLIYEYTEKAGPRSISGLPMFLSMRMLNKKDAKLVWDYYDEIKAMMSKFKKDEQPPKAVKK